MLSLAIGREGQNARLAAKLTGWRIDIRSAHRRGGSQGGRGPGHTRRGAVRPAAAMDIARSPTGPEAHRSPSPPPQEEPVAATPAKPRRSRKKADGEVSS
jgi:N utilization substance protein A